LAVLTDSLFIGGAEVFLAYLAGALPPEVEVHVIAVADEVLERIGRARPGAHRVLVTANPRGAYDALRQADPDVVLINLPSFTANRAAWLAALLQRRKTVVVDHAPTPGLTWRGRALQRLMTAPLHARVAVGPGTARDVERWGGLKPGSVMWIRNGIPPCDQVRPRTEGPFTVGMLTRLDPGKGIDLCLQAIAGLDDVRLLVAGTGPARDDLQATARRLGVAGRVEFAGFVEPPDLLSHIDIFALPSRAEGGCLPLALLEAMHSGVPTVVSRFGCVPEVLEDRRTAMVVPIDDATSLANAINALRTEESLRRSIAANARSLVREQFTATEMAAGYNSIFTAAGKPGRHRHRPPTANP
jgi:glycosyltransferase involved in cell wall biosynthesis